MEKKREGKDGGTQEWKEKENEETRDVGMEGRKE